MKKYLLPGVVCLCIGCLLRAHPAFAADATTPAADTGRITQIFNALLKFLSWGWMIMAFLAGKLMSNTFIYGTFLHLDSALFKLWNYMKNIANFILGFLFLIGILKSFFTKEVFDIKTLLPRFLLAGVLIQASRFIMGVFIDLSNIATAAVGAFPTQFIQGSTDDLSKSKMTQLAVTVPDRIDISFKENAPLFTTHDGSQTIESMFGKFNDMSGPLLFMGASIFRFQDYDILNTDITNLKNFSIGLFIKLFLLIAFTVPMFVLVVINLVRIFKLWIWISFSPLAVIAWSFEEKAMPGPVKQIGETLGFGKLSDVLSLIFQPVAMIGALSLAMILSIGMYYVLGGDPGNQQSGSTFSKKIQQMEITTEGKTSTLKDNTSGTEISVEGDLFKDVGNFVGGMIGYLIVTGFTIVLIWSLIKIAASFSKFTASYAKTIFDRSEKLVTNTNIIPVGGAFTSLAGMKESAKEGKNYLQSGSYADTKVDADKREITTGFFNNGRGKLTAKTFGIKQTGIEDISTAEKSAIERVAISGNANDALQTIQQIMQKGQEVTPQSRNFKAAFSTLMEKNKEFRSFILKGAGITNPKDFDDNKSHMFEPSNPIGQKILRFIAYTVNHNMSLSDHIPDESELVKQTTADFGNTRILEATPLFIKKGAPKEEK